MKPRKRFVIPLLLVALIAAFCSAARVHSQDHARPRDDGGGSRARQDEHRRGDGEARQPRAGRSGSQSERDQDRAHSRSDAERRHPRPNYRPRGDIRPYGSAPDPSYDARRRHPQPDGRWERRYPQWDRYHWRYRYDYHRWDRDRFPRFFFGFRLFDGFLYLGRPFGPHYGLWYRDDSYWRLFYWPFPYPPARGCAWYFVPHERRIVYDPYTGEEFWDYTDYRYVYLCID